MSVLLHIGWEKTGTKSIQSWLRDHEQLLADNGICFPRGWLKLNCHQELPLTLMRLDRLCSPREQADEWRDVGWRADVLAQVRQYLHEHEHELVVLSSENLDLFCYDDEFEALHSLVGDALIVAYLREPTQWLESLRTQYVHKNGHDRTLSDDPWAYNYLEPGTWRADYEWLLDGWRRWFSQVRVIDYDEATARDGSVVPSFLRQLEWPGLDLAAYHLNARAAETPRPDGNRFTNGLLFGQGASSQPAGKFLWSSTPAS